MMGIIVQIPLFDNTQIPTIVKILSTLVITYAFFPFVEKRMILEVQTFGVDQFWFLTIVNTLIGIIIGLLIRMIMNLFIASGSIITQQIGFAAVNYFDPSSAQRVGPFENLIKWTMIVLILFSGALKPMFEGMLKSFHSISLGNFVSQILSSEYFLNFAKVIFSSALMLASPLIFINILVMCVLGIISRIVPQMNIIMVSFAINIGMGLLIFFATSFEFFNVSFDLYVERLADWYKLIS